MSRKIEKAAVLGAGIMGSGIAAHLANCGIRTVLLDIVPPELTEEDRKKGLTRESPEFRNRFAANGLANAIKNKKPIPAFYHDGFADLVRTGNLEDHLEWLKDCDWVVEVVVENLEIKRKLFERIEPFVRPGAIVSSNTSGISIRSMIEGRGAAFRKNFLVTHFFNPVRFMRLLELVPGEDTDPAVVEAMAEFGTNVLGKGVVFGKDTTNFVGNRIGIYGLIRTVREMLDQGYTIEEADAIVGEPMGRPKTAAFRTVDMVGLDTVVHILHNCYDTLPDDEEREIFRVPPFIQTMIERKQFGDKTKGGFYKKLKGEGKKDVLVLDHTTGEYREKQKVRFDSLGAVRNIEDPGERLKQLLTHDDRAAKFAWNVLRDSLIYSGNRVGEICDDIVQIDNAMKWGYNWALGPFEAWDAIGVKAACERMQRDGKKLPKIAEALLAAGFTSFYKTEKGRRYFFDGTSRSYKPVAEDALTIRLPLLKQQDRVVAHNDSATLYDMGDGVLCCEFHTKMNSIDQDIISQLNHGLDLLDRDDRWIGMVLGNHGEAFCAGANVFALIMAAQQGLWDQVEGVVKAFQDVNQRLKYSRKPTVAAPFAMTLGGGAELSMACNRICAHADLFMGLVEVGVGLIPGGGGHKEMLIRHLEGIPEQAQNVNPIPFLQAAFQNIGMAKVSMSAHEAQALKFLRPSDIVVTNKEHLLGRAKRAVQAMWLEGFTPPRMRKLRLPGEMIYATFQMVLDSMCKQHQITEHEQLMAGKIAWVLSGGKTSINVEVSEQYLLDLEREAFCFLLGTAKTQERIQHFLMKGKPLRN
ncbi:MAG: 3-hydroxyacyl-CoA dehydrogenase/enoyl-CoA hydratase family protein [Myxococcales bacterium]|nr:3-hydroxyacyl-CoA dehydrogenase/enoyl-CoA hydratase family protein [Myxococcales bacterium]